MKKVIIILIIVASALVMVGTSLFVLTMYMGDWDIRSLETSPSSQNEYTVADSSFDKIEIESSTAKINLLLSNDGSARVVCVENENIKHTVTVENGTLFIKEENDDGTLQNIGFSLAEKTVNVYLPQAEYTLLTVVNTTGDVEIPESFTFGEVSVITTTGEIELEAKVGGKATLTTTTGKISAENTSVGSLYATVTTGKVEIDNVNLSGDITVNTTTGKLELSDVCAIGLTTGGSTGDVKLEKSKFGGNVEIKRTTGNVKLEDFDAENIIITTTTGNVSGNILSDKIYITETSTGRVEAPKTSRGGRCEITTSTGNINIYGNSKADN